MSEAEPVPEYRFEFELRRDEAARCIHLWGRLRCDRPGLPPTVTLAELDRRRGDGFVTRDGRHLRVHGLGVPPLIDSLRLEGSIRVPFDRESQLRAILARIPWHEAETEEPAAASPPAGHLFVDDPRKEGDGADLWCRLSFVYGDTRIPAVDLRAALVAAAAPVVVPGAAGGAIRRDPAAERALVREFLAAGGRVSARGGEPEQGRVARDDLPALVRTLVDRGWVVEANGRAILQAAGFHGAVRGGIDWLELRGGLRFGAEVVELPALLRAAAEGSAVVALRGGGLGVIPAEWLARLDALRRLGTAVDGAQRFRPDQALVLDALLAAGQGTRLEVDAAFAALRERVRRFRGFRPQPTPPGLNGELRPYQQDALGWMQGLAELGLGGCLADDMGLGKTVQVLALLHAHYRPDRRAGYARPADHRPSLIVAPRSLVLNWQREARRFSPRLRTLVHCGAGRPRDPRRLRVYDLVITTYGTLRRDLEQLGGIAFDYAVLDEAQAIKNTHSQTAKAARLVDARHRLALSGTPIENHLGELWSLFEFLNPGMLGRARDLDAPLDGLADAVRPFFLRRTKRQVLRELPDKTEQTLLCHLGDAQRREYDALLRHYQHALLAGDADLDRMHVLEALLRLRQAACHLGLLDPARAGDPAASAKLDVLLPMLEQLTANGHKALVFSQFTTMLGLTAQALRARGIEPLYLDGRTRDRQAPVDAFQRRGGPAVFLISIKAGGAGLNLTAADHVFLLDPWWNPAVEAQAIDRSHRMGQRRPVTACRLIAAGTIEERVRALQDHKRELAEAVFGPDNSVLRGLTRESLQVLLG